MDNMLKLFKKKEESKADAEVEQGSLLCPKCRTIMNKKIYKSIVMDVCPKCNSVFLDDGELEKIEEFK